MSNVMKFGVGFVVLGLIVWNIGCSKGTAPTTPMPAPQQNETTTLPTEGNPVGVQVRAGPRLDRQLTRRRSRRASAASSGGSGSLLREQADVLERGELVGDDAAVVVVAVHLHRADAEGELGGVRVAQRAFGPAREAIVLLDDLVADLDLEQHVERPSRRAARRRSARRSRRRCSRASTGRRTPACRGTAGSAAGAFPAACGSRDCRAPCPSRRS